MFRKSALAMAMLGALATQKVAALGLGEIELKSALNQPLAAEVELLSATPAEIKELRVAIASSQAFEDAGLERPLFLTTLKFDVQRNAAGKPVVQITSRDVVREPFLDFLLELSWSKGRLLREYTVLVDPPVTMPAPAPVITQAQVGRMSTPSAPSAQVQSVGRVQHTAQMPPLSVTPGEYRTQRNDTLWKVAESVRPDADVSMEQTMLGLLRTNPDAFYDNNINNLKAGYILRVPSRDEMISVSQAQALRETRAQYQTWRQAQQGGPAEAQPAEGTTQAAAVAAEPATEAQLQLVAPELAESGTGGGSAEEAGQLDLLKRDLMMANEALEAQRRQGEEMSGRVAVLEEQIRNMQRLVQLKDDQLAQLQAQVGDTTEVPVTEAESAGGETTDALAEEMPAAGADASVAETDAGAGEPVVTAGEEIAAETEMPGEAVEAMIEEAAAPSEPTSIETLVPEVSEEAIEASSQLESAVEPQAPETSTPAGLVDQILANPLWLGAGGVLLALLAFFGLRKKRSAETGFEESILQASQGTHSADDASELAAAGASGGSNETSLLSEFAVSDMGSIKHGGEADPLAEADVYLAYGRFQQAEDLISDALQTNGDDEALNLKMLEVFLAAKNQAGFDAHAQTMLARLTERGDPLWEKVSEMGRELNPDNPLYQGGGSVAHDVEAFEETESLPTAEDLDITGVESEADMGAETEEVSEARRDEDEGLDFDIDLSYEADEIEGEEKPRSGESASAEVEFDELGMDSLGPDALEKENLLDFDLEGLDLGGEEELEGEVGDGELTDLDEVSTKLDLARAYIDMGDPDGAKSILDEVLEEGSADQQNEAKGIMEQIS